MAPKSVSKVLKALNASDPDAQSRFGQIVGANAIFCDPKLRAVYDRMLKLERRRCRPQSKFVAINPLRKHLKRATEVTVVQISGGRH
jgi:DnaJ-class molecular chaperone